MSVYQRGNGTLYFQFMFRGKNYIKSCNTKNRKQAERMEAQFKEELVKKFESGQLEDITLREIVDQFLEHRKKARHIHAFHAHGLNLINRLGGDKNLGDIQQKDITRLVHWHQKEDFSDFTIKGFISFLSVLNKFAQELGYNHYKQELPKISPKKRRVRYLSDEEQQLLLNELDPDGKNLKHGCLKYRQYRDGYDFTVLALDTAARTGEVLSLPWKAVDLKKREIYLYRQKVRNASIIPMTDRAYEVLKRRFDSKGKGDYVFQTDKGFKERITCVRAAIEKLGFNEPEELAKWDGTRVTIHTLRKSTASKLAQDGVPLQDIAQLLGHTSTRMVESTYSELVPNRSISRCIQHLKR